MPQRELHALKRCTSTDGVGALLGDSKLDDLTRIELLSTALPFEQGGDSPPLKEFARERYRDMVLGEPNRPSELAAYLDKARQKMRTLGLDASPSIGLAALPAGTVALDFTFTLAHPYISRDDDALYIIDNPVRKDKVFGTPYVAASSWKGSLRHTVTRLTLDAMHDLVTADTALDADGLVLATWPLRVRDWRLFGNENEATADYVNRQLTEYLLPPPPDDAEISDEERAAYAARFAALHETIERTFTDLLVQRGYRADDVEGRRGRLNFYPTYFDRLGLEIINPHDRERKVGKPIYFECVPAGAAGRFSLLYAPLDHPISGTSQGAGLASLQQWRQEIAEDLLLLAQGLRMLMYVYGFGAKTSSGYGTARPAVTDGSVAVQIGGAIRRESFAVLDDLPAAAARLAEAMQHTGGGA